MADNKKKKDLEKSGAQKFLYNVLYPFGLISTVAIFSITLLTELLRSTEMLRVLTLRGVTNIIVFCFFFALANRIFHSKTLSAGAKIALHCLALTADFTVIFIFFQGIYKKGAGALAIVAGFVAIYLIAALIAAIIRYIAQRIKSSTSDYTKQF